MLRMDANLSQHSIAESERLNTDESSDWASLESLWQPCVDQGDVEAQFRLAYFYLFCGFDEGQQKRTQMEALLRNARKRPTVLYSSVICCWPTNLPA